MLLLPASLSGLGHLTARACHQLEFVVSGKAEPRAVDSGSLHIAILMSVLFCLALALPLRLRVQSLLNLASAAAAIAGILLDGSCMVTAKSQGAVQTESVAHCLRSVLYIVFGAVVAPALCQVAIMRTSQK